MILEEETYKRFGYLPSELAPQSHKIIVVSCDDCGDSRVIKKYSYSPFCTSCVMKGEKNHFFGKHFTEKAKKKQSESHKGERNYLYGKHRSEVVKKKISEARKGLMVGDKSPLYGKHLSRETKRKIGEANKGKRNYFLGKHRPEETKRKMRETRKHQKFPKSKTKPELVFLALCEKHSLPFKFTGDGSFWIENLNPDFVDCNGKKIAVEIFGDYWHSPLLNPKVRYNRTLKGREEILKKYGWKLIVFWGIDLKRADYEQFVLQKLEKEGIEWKTY